jgi:hypothetical protein
MKFAATATRRGGDVSANSREEKKKRKMMRNFVMVNLI